MGNKTDNNEITLTKIKYVITKFYNNNNNNNLIYVDTSFHSYKKDLPIKNFLLNYIIFNTKTIWGLVNIYVSANRNFYFLSLLCPTAGQKVREF